MAKGDKKEPESGGLLNRLGKFLKFGKQERVVDESKIPRSHEPREYVGIGPKPSTIAAPVIYDQLAATLSPEQTSFIEGVRGKMYANYTAEGLAEEPELETLKILDATTQAEDLNAYVVYMLDGDKDRDFEKLSKNKDGTVNVNFIEAVRKEIILVQEQELKANQGRNARKQFVQLSPKTSDKNKEYDTVPAPVVKPEIIYDQLSPTTQPPEPVIYTELPTGGKPVDPDQEIMPSPEFRLPSPPKPMIGPANPNANLSSTTSSPPLASNIPAPPKETFEEWNERKAREKAQTLVKKQDPKSVVRASASSTAKPVPAGGTTTTPVQRNPIPAGFNPAAAKTELKGRPITPALDAKRGAAAAKLPELTEAQKAFQAMQARKNNLPGKK